MDHALKRSAWRGRCSGSGTAALVSTMLKKVLAPTERIGS
jgi:hypothetical protein